jgi:hypothetical protein
MGDGCGGTWLVDQATWETEAEESQFEYGLGKSMRLYLQKVNAKGLGMAQVVQCLSSKHKAQSSIPRTGGKILATQTSL